MSVTTLYDKIDKDCLYYSDGVDKDESYYSEQARLCDDFIQAARKEQLNIQNEINKLNEQYQLLQQRKNLAKDRSQRYRDKAKLLGDGAPAKVSK